jgi:hypothetical protein
MPGPGTFGSNTPPLDTLSLRCSSEGPRLQELFALTRAHPQYWRKTTVFELSNELAARSWLRQSSLGTNNASDPPCPNHRDITVGYICPSQAIGQVEVTLFLAWSESGLASSGRCLAKHCHIYIAHFMETFRSSGYLLDCTKQITSDIPRHGEDL